MDAREEAWRLMKKKLGRATIAIVALLSVVSWAVVAQDLAELSVVKLVLDPPSAVDRGQVIEVSARVMNTGSRSADGFHISLFYRLLDGTGNWTIQGTIEGVNLPPSQQNYYEAKFYFATIDLDLGTYELRVVADSADRISETDELNNELRTTVTLRDSSLGLPDLQPVSLTYAHTNPGAGDDMDPWNVTTQIRNLGQAQAGQFVVAFLVDGAEFARQIRFVLPAGGVTDIVAELDPQALGLQAGTHRVSVTVDPENAVAEQNEGNNTISGSLTLLSVELAPLSLAFDKSVVRLDEEVRVSAELRNDGDGVAKDIEVAFYAGHVRFATATIAILGRGMTAVVEGILEPDRAGLTDAPALYQIRVVADPNNLLHEADEANNELSRTLVIQPAEAKRSELHPESIELTPASPAEQGRANRVTISSVIRNTGRADATGVEVAFYYRVKGNRRWEPIPCADDVSCASLHLAAGAQARVVGVLNTDPQALASGIYEVRIVVDPANAVAELDETNNELLTTLTLLASRLPDLAFCPAAPITLEPAGDIQRGQTVRLTVCVTNLGEQDAGPFSVRFSTCRLAAGAAGIGASCDGGYSEQQFVPAALVSVPGLRIGETVSVPVMLETKELLPQQYRIRAEIDPTNAVVERNVANNLVESQVTVLGADLTVIGLATPFGTVIDQTEADELEVSATVLNLGVLAAGEFTVRFRLVRIDELGAVPVYSYACGDPQGGACREAAYFGTVTLSGIGTFVPATVRCALDLAKADLAPGQYVIIAEADCEGDVDGDGVCEGRVPEHNEYNNSTELPILLVGRRLPDLAARSLRIDPEEWSEETTSVRAVLTVANDGTKPATAFDMLLRVYRMDPSLACDGRLPLECADLVHSERAGLPGLIPDDAREVSWTLRRSLFEQPGRYIVRGDVDCDRESASGCVGRIEEADETNNVVELSFILEPDAAPPPACTTCPDLLVRSASAHMVNGAGQTAQVFATLENRGDAAAAAFTVRAYYVSRQNGELVLIDDPAHRTRFDGLAAGATASFRQDFDVSRLEDPFYDVVLVVDAEGEVLEADEENNTGRTLLWIH